ncbi:UNVERIFIED_CONTAM: hypothetical protein HDU68_012003, partial [Siphonaria sp. JEL0065]
MTFDEREGTYELDHVVMRQILQRLPGFLLLCLIPFVMLVPFHAPTSFAVYYGWLSAVFMLTAFRTTLGVINIWISSVRHSSVDWINKRDDEVTSLRQEESNLDDEFMTIKDIYHVIIIPNYKESIETLVETLDVLASHPISKSNYKVCLAMEEGEAGCEEKAKLLLERFQSEFHTLTYTVHPKNIPGEARGKSSNTNWACRKMYMQVAQQRVTTEDQESPIADSNVARHVFTCMDADTCFAADYFLAVAYKYTSTSAHSRKAVIYMPSIIFDRNSDQVSVFVRLMDMGWSSSQMAFFLPKYPFVPATSAYSVPMELARAVGFWDTTWESVGEDLHMTLKCFFATSGRLQLQPIYSPASCFNVCGETTSFYSGVKARLGQLRRHSWAVISVAYTFRQIILWLIGRGSQLPKAYFQDPQNGTEPTSSYIRQSFAPLFMLFSILEITIWSTHVFILGILTGFFVPGTAVSFALNEPVARAYWKFITGSADTPVDGSILSSIRVASFMTVILVTSMLITLILYEGYYRWCTIGRWELNNPSQSPGAAGDMHPVLGKRPASIAKRRELWHVVEILLLPLVALVNLMAATISSLWQLFTDRLEYKTAAKPVGMAMALHLGLNDLVLFESFVPADWGQYIGALVFTFVLAVVTAWLGDAKKKLVASRIRSLKSDNSQQALMDSTGTVQPQHNSTHKAANTGMDTRTMGSKRSTTPLIARTGAKDSTFLRHQLFKFGLDVVRYLASFLVMLIVMQFNIGYLFAASFG